MNYKLTPLLCCLLMIGILHDAHSQDINAILDSNSIVPQMISYHPEGELFISTKSNAATKSKLLHITNLNEDPVSIDTLDFGYYLNISKLANDGDHLLYSFLDSTNRERKTYKRTYKNGEFSEPIDIKAATGIETLTYFMVDADEHIYYYTYSAEPSGLYLTTFENGTYTKPELLIPNKPNLVPFSPYLIDEQTMILAQHGRDDLSVNGIYVSLKSGNTWNEPQKLEGLPYGWSLGPGLNEGEIIYLTGDERRIVTLTVEDINRRIEDLGQGTQ